MADEFLGRLLDELERQGIFDETLIILTTDHGHLIGEHGCTGKNRWHAWNELCNLPLVAKLPGNRNAGQRRAQLSQNIDVMPTLLDYFGIDCPHAIHGESLRGVFERDAAVARGSRPLRLVRHAGQRVRRGAHLHARRRASGQRAAVHALPGADVVPLPQPAGGRHVPGTRSSGTSCPKRTCRSSGPGRGCGARTSSRHRNCSTFGTIPGRRGTSTGAQRKNGTWNCCAGRWPGRMRPPSQYARLGL